MLTVHYIKNGTMYTEDIYENNLAALPYSFRDGGMSELIEQHVTEPDKFWVTKKGKRKELTTEQLDEIRNAELD